ncbi:MAG: PD40 domain-containing protein [Acidobacteriaceae bacterium]|nr:PD40 domain-containing protein [Acidobacteriaceae bacterium]
MQGRGEPKRLTADHRPNSSPVWMPDGRSLLFTRYNLPGQHSLWKIALSSTLHLEPLPVSADDASALALSARGDRLLYTRQMNNANLWSVEVRASESIGQAKVVPRQWGISSREDWTPSFSPDGQQVAFQSTRSGWSEIWIADRDGSHPRQLTELKGSIAGFPHWSPDGKKIVFHSRQQSYARLFLLDLSTSRPTPLRYEAINDYQPSWSHDGRWLYFASRRSGERQVWKVPAEGGPVVQVTRHGGWDPLESPDGQYLYCVKPGNSIWRMPLPGGEEQPVSSEVVSAMGSAYAPGRKGIYFIRQAGPSGQQSLVFVRLPNGQKTTLAEISRPLEFGLALSPDERTILYSQIDHVSSDLMLVEHFH